MADIALSRLGVISLQVSATMAQARRLRHIPAHRVVGETVPAFIRRLKSRRGKRQKAAVTRFVHRVTHYGGPLIEGSTVYFFYVGRAAQVSVPGELNDWNPSLHVMSRVRGTNFHYLAVDVPGKARFEYKLSVDKTWILDPYNRRRALEGSGPNSEVAMPAYHAPEEIRHRAAVAHGDIDAITVASRFLKRSHPVFIYLPHGYRQSRRIYPSLYVLDGGDYLSLGMMATVLDNMIAATRVRPIIGVFVEPRTDIAQPATNWRTTDYTMNDAFVNFLVREVRPVIERRYRVSLSAGKRGIMGASLGGLVATYAAYKRPSVFSLCAAQSPSYWWKDRMIVRTIAGGPAKPVRFYLDTGIINDSLETARNMRDVLREKGYRYRYTEHPEGHNWGNWRARIPDILEYFWGLP